MLQVLINVAVAVVVPLIGWLIKSRSILYTQLTDLRIEVAKEYVRHDHLNDIKSALIRIETKLDLKADKA